MLPVKLEMTKKAPEDLLKRTGFCVNQHQYNLLSEESKQTGCSIASIIRNSIAEHFKNKEMQL